jgi:hypothetical protein
LPRESRVLKQPTGIFRTDEILLLDESIQLKILAGAMGKFDEHLSD